MDKDEIVKNLKNRGKQPCFDQIQQVDIKDISRISRPFVLAVSNVLTAPIFSNSRNFGMEGDTPEKHGIKSLDP